MPNAESQSYMNFCGENHFDNHPEAIAMDCEMVGGGSDGSLDLCARVCLTDEDEKILFHTYVRPQLPITNYRYVYDFSSLVCLKSLETVCSDSDAVYRYEITGLTEDHLTNAMPLKDVHDKILEILYNGESIGRSRLDGGKAKLLVGHDLDHDLDCMAMYYPQHLLRYKAFFQVMFSSSTYFMIWHQLNPLGQYEFKCSTVLSTFSWTV